MDFAAMRVWSDEDATSTNPICLDDIHEQHLYQAGMPKKEDKKKKRRRRRKKISDEESSVADSMLSSILSESDEAPAKKEPAYVPQTKFHEKREIEKQRRREKLEELKNRRNSPKKEVQPMRTSLYPSSDEESENEKDDLSKNPFVQDDLSLNPFSDKNNAKVEDDDLSKNPFSDKKAAAKTSTNPFGDDSMRDRASWSESEESSTIRPPPLSMYLDESKKPKSNNPFDNDDEESDDEDIIESSKRLLRCVDQRIQYQQQNDEVHSLKTQLKQMRTQAEAMAEQLRRAVETKCDLVLAQNEMERLHEQNLIAKDGEVHDLRMYIQDILDQQAKSELNFMNEIASLAGTMENNKKKHAREIQEKESRIQQLESHMEAMRVSAVREISSESFHKRFAKDGVVNPSYE